MKKILSFFAIAAVVCGFSSCATEQENVFDKSAAERMDQALTDYTARLKDSKGGWIMEYYPNEEQDPVLIAVRFNADGSCTMGMNNKETSYVYLEDISLWQMIADNGPVLSFNTYNECLHTYATPDPNYIPSTGVYDGDGYGYEGDYEFNVISCEQDADHIMLKGKKRGTYIRMSRLPEGTDFEEYLNDIEEFRNRIFGTSASAPNYLVLDCGEKKYKLEGITGDVCRIYPYGGDAISEETFWPFLITKCNDKYSLRFRDAFSVSDNQSFQELLYDEAEGIFVSTGDQSCRIVGPNTNIFMIETLEAGHKWQVNTSSMSDELATEYRKFVEQASSLAYTFKTMTFSGLTDGVSKLELEFTYVRRVNGRNQTIKATATFNVRVAGDEDHLELQYVGPADDSSQNVINVITSIETFINKFCEMKLSTPKESPLLLDNMVLKNESSSLWADIIYVK